MQHRPFRFRKRPHRGFTLTELMIVVAIIGVLAGMGVAGVRKYLAVAKGSEARNALGSIGRSAVMAYDRGEGSAQSLGDGTSSNTTTHALCGSATAVPTTVPKGVKYQPNSANGKDFDTGTTTGGWQCLKFSISQPIYYRYSYIVGTSGILAPNNPAKPATANSFEAGASGDLDGDGTVSKYALTGTENTATKSVRISSRIYSEDEDE